MVGKTGRVTGRIGPGLLGEVMLPVRGGREAFYAYSYNDQVIEVGTRVLVMEFDQPRDVYVAPFNG